MLLSLSAVAPLVLGLSTAGNMAALRMRSVGPMSMARSAVLSMDEADASQPLFYKQPAIDASTLTVGQVVPCTVLEQLSNGGYSVDIGIGRPATLPKHEVRLKPNATTGRRDLSQGWGPLDLGSIFEAQVMGMSETDVNVSLAKAQRAIAWRRVKQLSDEDVTISANVMRLGDVGATLDVEGLPAFLPWSHWQVPMAERSIDLIGSPVMIKILECDITRARLVVSHRRYRLEKAMAAIEQGSVVTGTVTAIKPYGATVRVSEDVEGLLHISQISQLYVRNVSDVFEIGAPVGCVVIKMDVSDGSVSLSTKMLEKKPGEMVRNSTAVYERAIEKLASGVGATAD